MKYAKVNENNEIIEYPISDQELAIRLGSLVTADALPAEYVPVYRSNKPAFNDIIENLVDSAPVFTNGVWVENWSVGPKFSDYYIDATGRKVRNLRNPTHEVKVTKEEQEWSALTNVFATKLQEKLNAFAKTRNYDSIESLCSYATDPNPAFQAEGQRGVVIRSQVWAEYTSIVQQVVAGTLPRITTFAALEQLLTAFTWE